MKRTTYKTALAVRFVASCKQLSKEEILKKFRISGVTYDRMMAQQTLTSEPKKREKGTFANGEAKGSKLKEIEAKMILKFKDHFTVLDIFEILDGKISVGAIRKVISGESWRHLSPKYRKEEDLKAELELLIEKRKNLAYDIKKVRGSLRYLKNRGK